MPVMDNEDECLCFKFGKRWIENDVKAMRIEAVVLSNIRFTIRLCSTICTFWNRFHSQAYDAGTAPMAPCDNGVSSAVFSISGTPSPFSASPLIPSTTLNPSASCTS